MAFKPSERIKGEGDEELNLNLNSMMDMFAVLIPALLMMSAVVEVSTIRIASPSINNAASTPPPAPDKPPLNLTVMILDSGYVVTGTGAPDIVPDQAGENPKPNIPITEKTVVCSRYRGTRPPPRSRNEDRQMCDPKNGRESRLFWMYDTTALTQKIIALKNAFPDERRVTITPGPDVEYETIVDVMDATRDIKEPSGEVRSLFDEVVMSPSLL